MSENDRDEHGQFQPEHTDREFLDAVADREPAGTTEIAEVIGVTRQNADRRLRQLEADRRVTSKKIGRSIAWSLADSVDDVQQVDEEDDFWDADTFEGEEMSASDIDDVLYG